MDSPGLSRGHREPKRLGDSMWSVAIEVRVRAVEVEVVVAPPEAPLASGEGLRI